MTRMTSETDPTIAVAVVVEAGRVLVGRRPAAAVEAPGFDEFPGGKIEPHETAAEAAARECLEETGIPVRVLGRSLFVAAAAPPAISFHWATPVLSAAAPRPPFAWIPVADLPLRRFPEANAPVLALLLEEAAMAQGGS